MIRISVRDKRYIYPFNDYARDLRLANRPLWLHHNDVFEPITDREREADNLDEVFDPGFMAFEENKECIVYRDNLFFDKFFLDAFLKEAKKRNKPCRVAFSPSDPAFKEHALPLMTRSGRSHVKREWPLSGRSRHCPQSAEQPSLINNRHPVPVGDTNHCAM